MNKTLIILTLIVFSCDTKSTEKADSTKSNLVPEDSINISPNNIEDFNEFFENFKKDSSFQVKRVKFPLKYMTSNYDGETVEEMNKQDWRHLNFYYEESYSKRQIDAYTQQIKIYRDIVKLELRGVDNGIHIDYEFAKNQGKWFLVLVKDYSN